MKQSQETVEKVQKAFIAEYIEKEPFRKYLSGVNISTIGRVMNTPSIVSREKIKLGEGENLEDLCLQAFLHVGLPPENLKLPSEYQGVRVFYYLIEDCFP